MRVHAGQRRPARSGVHPPPGPAGAGVRDAAAGGRPALRHRAGFPGGADQRRSALRDCAQVPDGRCREELAAGPVGDGARGRPGDVVRPLGQPRGGQRLLRQPDRHQGRHGGRTAVVLAGRGNLPRGGAPHPQPQDQAVAHRRAPAGRRHGQVGLPAQLHVGQPVLLRLQHRGARGRRHRHGPGAVGRRRPRVRAPARGSADPGGAFPAQWSDAPAGPGGAVQLPDRDRAGGRRRRADARRPQQADGSAQRQGGLGGRRRVRRDGRAAPVHAAEPHSRGGGGRTARGR